MLRLAFDFIITWRETRTRPNAYERIVKRLGKMSEGLQINTLVIDTNIPVNRMSALLFELEMKGVIRALAGGVYRLIM